MSQKNIFLKKTTLCKEASSEEKEECILNLAIETADIELCKKILGGPQCFGGIAGKTKDFNLYSQEKIEEIEYPEFLFSKECFKEAR